MTRKYGKSGRPSGRPGLSASILGHPGASFRSPSLARGSFVGKEVINTTVDFEGAVRQSTSAAAAQFSTERGTFPRNAPLQRCRGVRRSA